jgi:outer membrane protein OmpA-like peptidoglycan-associated protein
MRRLPVLAVVLALAAPLCAAAQEVDPHDPTLEAAAREALSRAVVRQITGRVLPIKGLSSATSGRVEQIRNLAAELRSAGFLVTATDAGLRVNIPDNVLFDFDKADLRADAQARLATIAQAALKLPDLPVKVEGHTDGKGTPAYNQQLSDRRAGAVRQALVRAGLAQARITAAGFGATRPVAPNALPDGRDNPAGRQQNRRVEILIGA